MREAGFAWRFLQRPKAVPDRSLHDWCRAILDDDDLQPVVQRGGKDRAVTGAALRSNGLWDEKHERQRQY
jgi:hypothetical protein